MNWNNYECEGQMSIFDLTESQQPLRTLNDYWKAEALGKPIRLTTKELKAEQDKLGENVGWYFAADVPMCCECFPIRKHTGGIDEKSYIECIICGRKTNPVSDYSWRESRRLWTEMFKPICKYSNHSCNKENLWEVAEMDGGTCKRVCCRQCDIVGCGARCNGSDEPKKEEPKPVEVIQYTTEEYAKAIVKHLIEHCRRWGMTENIERLRKSKTTEVFHKLFCKVTRTYYVNLYEWYFNVEFCKDNTVNIKRCGRDFSKRGLDATIQLQDVLNEL